MGAKVFFHHASIIVSTAVNKIVIISLPESGRAVSFLRFFKSVIERKEIERKIKLAWNSFVWQLSYLVVSPNYGWDLTHFSTDEKK